MKYMQVSGNDSRPGLCSDDACPCGYPGAEIEYGKGYMYVSDEVVEFRMSCPTESEAQLKIQSSFGGNRLVMPGQSGVFAPILMCELGAKKRGIDLDVAAKDAEHWWRTGEVPLRTTPLADGDVVEVADTAVVETNNSIDTNEDTAAKKSICQNCKRPTEDGKMRCNYCGKIDWPPLLITTVLALILISIGVFICNPGFWKWFWIVIGSIILLTSLSMGFYEIIILPPATKKLIAGNQKAIKRTINYLGYRHNREVREHVIEGLVETGEPVIKPLLAALNNKKANVRVDAIEVLGKIGNSIAVEPLIYALKDEEEKVRKEAAIALGKIGNSLAEEPLKNALGDEKDSVSTAAAIALYKLDTPRTIELLITVLEKGGREERLETIIELGELGDSRAIEPLIKAFSYFQDLNDYSLLEIALRKFGSLALEPLIDALNDNNYIVRLFSARLLGDIGDTRAIEPLINALNDSYSQISGGGFVGLKYQEIKRRFPVRLEAELALKRFDDPRAEEALAEYRDSSVQGAVNLGIEKSDSDDFNKGMINNLNALKKRVEALLNKYPPNSMALIPKAEDQIPWICRTLEEAASALIMQTDKFGNSITEEQVKGGLLKLVAMVNDHQYLTVMEMKYPGISNPLKSIINELQELIEPPREVAPYSKGIETLVKLWAPGIIFYPVSSDYKRIAEEINEEGESGSRALAVLIGDLLTCRSKEIAYALRVAEYVNPTPELIDVVRAVANAPGLTKVPVRSLFTPEIIGGGQVGWTDGTHKRVIDLAQDILHKFIEPEFSEVVTATDVKRYRIDYENGTSPIGDLPIGSRVVDPSWEWEFRTGADYSESGAVKSPTWIIVAKDHYDGLEPHVTLLAEELIGRYPFDTSTNHGSDLGNNHWGESGISKGTNGLRPWLNSTGTYANEGFYNIFSDRFKETVLETTLPNKEWQNGTAYSTQDHVFIPSTTELGDTIHNSTYPIGLVYPYFCENASDAKRAALLGGAGEDYLTRSPASYEVSHVRYVDYDGGFDYSALANENHYGVRPALNLKSETLVSAIRD